MAFDGKQIRNATVVGAKLANLTITDAQLAANAVTTAKITNLAVDASKLAAGAVIEDKIADSAVTLNKLAANSVDGTKIADGSVTLAKLAANSVDGTKIADGSVALAKLAANSVDSSKIVDGSITGADIASNTVAAANLVTAYETGLLYRDGSRAMAGALDLGTGNKIVNLANPEQAQDAATKAYVDSIASNLDLKSSVRVATIENITLGNATTDVDGVTLAENDRVLAKNQTTATQNGIWVVSTSGAWARAADANTSAEVTSGLFTFVEEGTVNANTGWVLTNDGPITIGTTEIAFTQFSGAGSYLAGFGLTLTGNQFAVDFNDSPAAVAPIGPQSEAGVSNAVARADHAHALADGIVTEVAIADGAITSDKIAPEAVGQSHLDSNYEENLFFADGSRPLTGNMDAGGFIISNLDIAAGIGNGDAATVWYVKESHSWAPVKEAVTVATTGPLDIATLITTGGAVDVDGVEAKTSDQRILVKDQTNAAENGIYIPGSSAWIRADDFDQQNIRNGEVRLGVSVVVLRGAENAHTHWTLTDTNAPGTGIVVGTHNLVFTSTDDQTIADTALSNTAVNDDGHAGRFSGARALKIDASPFGYQGKALNDVDLNTHKIVNLDDPEADQDAATKGYVDAQIVGAGGGSDSDNKNMVAEVTTADGDLACDTAMFSDANGYVQVFVNGIKAHLTADLTGDCYFSANGTLAKALDLVNANDKLYWNGSIAGYELAISDRIDFDYTVKLSPG